MKDYRYLKNKKEQLIEIYDNVDDNEKIEIIKKVIVINYILERIEGSLTK